MTRRLFYENVYLTSFDAKVVSCEKHEKGWQVILDQTAFYPEGGGQPSDLGTLGEARVLDVKEKGEEIIHTVDREFHTGDLLHGTIDWDRRFDLMQQHSGEHMVSGLIHERFGYDNVGFHMGSDVITIDLSGMITVEEMKEIEQKVNQLIWKNDRVHVSWPTQEELEKIPYRSKKELTGAVRIVEYPGADICACCGTHVENTGEIGMIKLLSLQKFREGVRIEMICGKRVLDYLNRVEEQNHGVSVALSAKPFQTADAVKRMLDENYNLKGKVAELENALFEALAEKYRGCGNVLVFQKGLDADSVRRLCDRIMKLCGGRCAVFSEAADGTFKYAMGEENGNLRDLTKQMNQELNGRGGGKPFFVQGSVACEKEKIQGFFEYA